MDLSDEALVENFKKTKDMAQFKSLVRRYQNRVYGAAVRILGNSDEAEEVVQDTFVRVHQNIDKFRNQATFAAWVFKIAHNQCVDMMRDKRRKLRGFHLLSFDPQSAAGDQDESQGISLVTQLADPTPGPEAQSDRDEQETVIAASLQQLPDTQREVLLLHDVEGFSYQEIADIVGASIGTVRSRLHYGRLKLRELLEPYFSTHNMSPAPR
ncbi:MAG TPA: sigma-70 family RNA polymerase sigma factor [Trichormus sp.]|jgi:RNA polymerase sigma-70 factor (ECF subfamily)